MPVADVEPLLRLQGVCKSFGGIQAVHTITFDVAAGESVGLVGPNGAGKTTLFNCVCGQLRPEEGTIIFDGQPLLGLPTYKRARLGIGRTYQKVEVFTDMSVRDHLLVAERSRQGEGRLWRDLLNLSKPKKDEMDEAARQLRRAAEPLLSLLSPSVRDSVQSIGRTAEAGAGHQRGQRQRLDQERLQKRG